MTRSTQLRMVSLKVPQIEVDTNTDETPACTPPTQPRAQEKPQAVRVPRKRKWDGKAEQEVLAAPARSRAIHEPSSRPKQKARKLVMPASSADIGRAAERKNSPSSQEDASARVSGRTADLPAPKAQTPLEEARRPSGQGRRHATPTNVTATDRCFASKQVPFDDSTSGQEPLAQTQLEESAEGEGWKEKTCVPSAQAPSAIEDRAREVGPPEAKSPTVLEMLAGSGAAVAVEEVARPSCRESPRISVATEILDSEDDSRRARGGRSRLLEQCHIARKADEELRHRMQSQCDEFRAQRADAELQLVEFEGDKKRATDRTREELVARVNRCLRGYTLWKVAARERVTLRELEICAAALMSGDSRSRRRVAKRLDSFLARSRDAIANLEAEVTAVLRRLGLRSKAED
ncbi:hypothetical protein AXG93_2789s1020 [Marchantia polymorpha subsp. ruderalis]|uniref:Uncharacterized protein n=1 Tax=Marchantia polymorpha subsp. ruderalis TaxID=1480154 RepID=A0A176W9U8_MARPO|nr:hypothetical protein AXG93_2789s1020 [Marchantia polymorpha subsp. ruderalis]